jgi:hypothetical protein
MPFGNSAAETDGVVICDVRSPIDVERHTLVGSLRFELRLFVIDDAFVDHQLCSAVKDGTCESGAFHFEIQPSLTTATTTTTTAACATSACTTAARCCCRWIHRTSVPFVECYGSIKSFGRS